MRERSASAGPLLPAQTLHGVAEDVHELQEAGDGAQDRSGRDELPLILLEGRPKNAFVALAVERLHATLELSVQVDGLASKRVKEKKGFYGSLATYVIVNAVLIVI